MIFFFKGDLSTGRGRDFAAINFVLFFSISLFTPPRGSSEWKNWHHNMDLAPFVGPSSGSGTQAEAKT